jgi:hypothetical protein
VWAAIPSAECVTGSGTQVQQQLLYVKDLPIRIFSETDQTLIKYCDQINTLLSLSISYSLHKICSISNQSPQVEGVALDTTGNLVVQMFHHTNTGGFLLRPLEYGKY